MLEKFHKIGNAFKREICVYHGILRDKSTPMAAKCLLGLAVGYLMMPFDLIPDFIPVIGQLDDLVIIPLLVIMAIHFIPDEIIEKHRNREKCLDMKDYP